MKDHNKEMSHSYFYMDCNRTGLNKIIYTTDYAQNSVAA